MSLVSKVIESIDHSKAMIEIICENENGSDSLRAALLFLLDAKTMVLKLEIARLEKENV